MVTVTFETIYHTQWGQRLVITGNIPELGNDHVSEALPMEYIDNGLWSQTLNLEVSTSAKYHYAVVDDKGEILDEEWGSGRSIPKIKKKSAHIFLRDGWRAKQHSENAFYNSAFLKVIFKPVHFDLSGYDEISGPQLRFEIEVPRNFDHLQLCVLGNIEELGNWNYEKPLLLSNDTFPKWHRTIKMPKRSVIQYKYGMYDPAQNKVLYLEGGSNRHFSTYGTQQLDKVIIRDTYFREPAPKWKGSGVAIPVFSLRSRNSFGVGAFTDLRLLIDWARETGLRMVQILPINDTSATNSWVDSYPYSSISVFALHPQYLDLTKLDGFLEVVDQKKYSKEQQALNKLPDIDYEKVISLKLKYARQLFNSQKGRFSRTKAFKEFLGRNKHWLDAYALFCVLRDRNGTPDYNKWKEHSIFSSRLLNQLTGKESPFYNEILFYYYLQFHLDRQLFDIAEYARLQGVVLKGDIAIGIYRYSADAWTSPHLFDMRSQAGAPPDPFSDLGQNWGFPTYRWEIMAQNNYSWWQGRLQNLSRYFDAFRIDHILGFFRIWQIPYHQIQGILGYFNPALPVTRTELEQRGIPFEKDRFCQPYITDEILNHLFSEDTHLVKQIFLEIQENGRYLFRDTFDSQRKIYQYLQTNPEYNGWRDRLFQLHAEVLFLEELDSDHEFYHPRIDFQKTFSYKALDASIQRELEELYIDYFYQRQEDFWKTQGLTKLPAVKNATEMLICGEDLGMIPACVPEVMRELDLLTLEIQRMSKNPKTEFLQEEDIPYLSVCSTSTHDMSPIRAWWEESEPDYIARFYHQELHMQGLVPRECSGLIAEQIIAQHLYWPGMWAVFPIQDILAMSDELKRANAMDERINIPANPNHYWRYRLHLDLEDLLENQEFVSHLRQLLSDSGRIS